MKSESTIFEHPYRTDSRVLTGETLEPFDKSIGAMLQARASEFSSKPILQEKGPDDVYHPITWEELFRIISNVGASLLAMGIRAGDRVAVLSENRSEMLIQETAVMSIGAISVPIFAGYFSHQIEFILNHSGARLLTVSTLSQLMKLTECKDLWALDGIFLMDHNPDNIALESVHGIAVQPFESIMNASPNQDKHAFSTALEAVNGEDSCLIMYTSGTTGNPKGVELTHNNLLSQQQAVRQLWNIGPDDRFLSYLPWHHSFGGLFERFMALYSGACLSIDESQGKNIQLILSNWRQIRPTVFFSVPGVYQRLANEIIASDSVRKEIFHDELRFVFTAAAPMPHDVSRLFTDAEIPVLEGWGLTETSPCATLTDPKRERISGVVGWPIPGVSVKLADDGEILVSGPNVMKGYYHDAERTVNALTPDCYFRTGDMGKIGEGGLRILGRRDGVFKLLSAEKVFAPQIEMALIGGSIFIEQAVIIGSGRNYITALIYPNWMELDSWGRSHHIYPIDRENPIRQPEVKRLFAHEVQRINTEIAGRFQRVRKFIILGVPLSLEAGELTPTAKVVRHQVSINNEELIDALYKTSCPPPLKAIVCMGDCY